VDLNPLNWWRITQRRIDLQILWPSCKLEAAEHHTTDAMDYAKAAFAVHAFRDPAWTVLGEEEIKRRIDALT
jgi:hypothetical protein